MTNRDDARPGLGALVLLLALAVLAACSSRAPAAAPTGGRSTSDARVKSFQGQPPPDVFTNGTWVSRSGPTSLAALRGRVVYLQFAFPQ